MRWFDAVRARLRLLSRRTSDNRFAHEAQFHVDMEADRLQREEGLDPVEARRRALVAFGGVDRYTEQMRDIRGLRWLGGMKLDVLLGLRMMARWPGLTLVGVLGMAVAVAIGTFSYGMVNMLVGPTVPIDNGHRVVMIENWDARSSRERAETHLHDWRTWRDAMPALEQFGAYRLVKRNLVTSGARPEPVQVAEMTASGFGVARVAPLMGRFLLEEDERIGALPVAVINHEVWQQRFGGAPDILGRVIQLGNARHQVVGVMPASFRFPVNNRIWVPLQLDPLRYEEGRAPSIKVFGRLADGASIAEAQAQANAVAARLAPTRPERFADIRTNVMEYGAAFAENPGMSWALHLVKLAVTLLLVVIGINVATLVFARTASRMGEIAVRTALGASRARIVAQLFAEAFVLSLAASIIGFIAAIFSFRYLGAQVQRLSGDALPYWFDFQVTPGMVLYVLGLAVLAACVVGAIPALKATGRDVRANLQALGGGGGIRLGRSWTVLIVAQVAVAVALLPIVVHVAVVRPLLEQETLPAYATGEWLTTAVQFDRSDALGTGAVADSIHAVRFAAVSDELLRRLRDDATIGDVVVMSGVPGSEPSVFIEGDSLAGRPYVAPSRLISTGSIRVDPGFFEAFEIPVLMGRALEPADATAANRPVLVNQPFVRRFFDGENVVGRRIRMPAIDDAGPDYAEAGPWYDIVGVVPDFPGGRGSSTRHPVVYHAMSPSITTSFVVAVHANGGTLQSVTGRLRELAMTVDPMLRLEDVRSLDEALSIEQVLDRMIYSAIVLVTLSVVLLSAAGIYALMAFTIARRRREIGIRAALGAGSRQIVGGVLARAARLVIIGITIGAFLALLSMQVIDGWQPNLRGLSSLMAVIVFMSAVGILAGWGPARAALRIQPTEALRSE